MCTKLRSKTFIYFKLATSTDETVFYEKLLYSVDTLKTSSKGKKVKQHCFSLMTSIYNDQAKLWLSQEEGSFESISKKDIATCNKQKQTGLCSREKFKKKWRSCCSNGDLFKTLTNAHSAIAHHRDKTEHYICEPNSGINQ